MKGKMKIPGFIMPLMKIGVGLGAIVLIVMWMSGTFRQKIGKLGWSGQLVFHSSLSLISEKVCTTSVCGPRDSENIKTTLSSASSNRGVFGGKSSTRNAEPTPISCNDAGVDFRRRFGFRAIRR